MGTSGKTDTNIFLQEKKKRSCIDLQAKSAVDLVIRTAALHAKDFIVILIAQNTLAELHLLPCVPRGYTRPSTLSSHAHSCEADHKQPGATCTSAECTNSDCQERPDGESKSDECIQEQEAGHVHVTHSKNNYAKSMVAATAR